MVELWRSAKGHAELRAALGSAIAWLAPPARERLPSAAAPPRPPTANSTGLAGWALGLTGPVRSRRATPPAWLAQPPGRGHAGRHAAGRASAAPIAYDNAALKAAKKDGITDDDPRPVASCHLAGRPGAARACTAAALSGVLEHVVRLVAAVLMTAAAGLGVSAPAQAATCCTAHGVTVVVDFHQLGGGVQIGV